MKYSLLLIVAPFFSLSAMQKPPAKPAAKVAEETPTDAQIQTLHEKVKGVRDIQTSDIGLIAARINAEFYTAAANYESPSASIMLTQKAKAPSFSIAVEEILEARIKEGTTEMAELFRIFTECQTALEQLEKKKKSNKKTITELDCARERGDYVTAQQATLNILKKSAEIMYYWSILLEKKVGTPNKIGVTQDE